MGGIDRITEGRTQRSSEMKKIRKDRADNSEFSGVWLQKALDFGSNSSYSTADVIYAGDTGASPRGLSLKFAGKYKNTFNNRSKKFMTLGNLIHSQWKDYLSKAKILIADEQRVNTSLFDFSLRGRIDFLINHEGEKEIIELKTTGLSNWSSLVEPDPFHLAQLVTYMWLLELDHGYVVYVDRDSLDFKSFPVKKKDGDITLYDVHGVMHKHIPGYIDDMIERWHFAVWCARNNYLPNQKCEECIKWGCNQQCDELEKSMKVISREEWKKLNEHSNS